MMPDIPRKKPVGGDQRRKAVVLPSNEEIARVVALARELGLSVAAVDVRADGVRTIPPGAAAQESAFDAWKKTDRGQ